MCEKRQGNLGFSTVRECLDGQVGVTWAPKSLPRGVRIAKMTSNRAADIYIKQKKETLTQRALGLGVLLFSVCVCLFSVAYRFLDPQDYVCLCLSVRCSVLLSRLMALGVWGLSFFIGLLLLFRIAWWFWVCGLWLILLEFPEVLCSHVLGFQVCGFSSNDLNFWVGSIAKRNQFEALGGCPIPQDEEERKNRRGVHL